MNKDDYYDRRNQNDELRVLAQFLTLFFSAMRYLVLPTRMALILDVINGRNLNTIHDDMEHGVKKSDIERAAQKTNRFKFLKDCMVEVDKALSALELYLPQRNYRILSERINRRGMSYAKVAKLLTKTSNAWRDWLSARQRLIEKNIGLVNLILTSFLGVVHKLDLSRSDLASAGKVGLITAIDNFDGTYQRKFSTYATWWIMRRIQHSLLDRRFISIPNDRSKSLRELLRVQNDVYKKTGILLSYDEIVFSDQRFQSWRTWYRNSAMNACAVAELDASIRSEDENSKTFVATVPSRELDPAQSCILNEEVERLRECMTQLQDRERFALALKFCFDVNSPWLNLADYLAKRACQTPCFQSLLKEVIEDRRAPSDAELRYLLCRGKKPITRQAVNQIVNRAKKKLMKLLKTAI